MCGLTVALPSRHNLTGRYSELLLLLDTCHAEPVVQDLTAPGIFAIAASLAHEESQAVRACIIHNNQSIN